MPDQWVDRCRCGELLTDHANALGAGPRPCLWCACEEFVHDGESPVRREVSSTLPAFGWMPRSDPSVDGATIMC